jgi:hypothetical protein
VSGIVRDRATGRAIAGARVVGEDGSLAETDAQGRFRLYVRGAHADVRVSASGHSSEHLEIEGLDARVELAPLDTWIVDTHETSVVTFLEETWVIDASAHDASMIGPHAAMASSCEDCHDAEARAVRGDGATIAAHDRLGDGRPGAGCIACHGTAGADASTSCSRCHGRDASRVTTALTTARDYARRSTLDPSSTTYETTPTEPDRVTLASWARALARDRSRGAHDPRSALALSRAIE